MGSEKLENRTNSLQPSFNLKLKTEKLKGSEPIQLINKFSNSGNNQELWGVNTDFSSYELKWTIDASLQHLGFYPTTENACVMMRVNHITKSCEYIIIYHDELYIALTTLEEIIYIVKDKYKIKINPHVYQGSNFSYLHKEIYEKVIHQ